MTKSIFLFFLSFILFISCDKQEDANLNTSNTNDVNTNVALDIAQSFFKNNTTSKGVKKSKTIDNIIVHKTKKSENAFYVINYKEGGFLVISADNRISPILAFSDTGSFSSTPTEIIPPVQAWMQSEKEQIQNVIDHKLTQNKEVKQEWKALTDNNSQIKSTSTTSRIEPDPITYCPDITVQKGPFLTTTWDQGYGYNNLVPLNCLSFGGKALTGCVATAMAQVLRYFHKSNTYNWANMPNSGSGTYGTYDLQLLMKNAGSAVAMQYTCDDGSSAYPVNIAPALKNTFGYSNASYTTTYNLSIITNNIDAGKPVILSGWGNYGGHTWVCDGYSQSTFYSRDDYGNCTGEAVTYTPILHMNWGWEGKYDAYYSTSNFNPDRYSFNTGCTIVYNITL